MTAGQGTTAEVLAGWASNLRLADVPDRTQRTACAHLLDGVGTALAAARTDAAAASTRVAASLGGPPEATVIGRDLRLSAPAAAFANGVLVHALDFDDTHAGGLVHATAAVLPTAFAVGEQVEADGAAVLRAAIAGYEVVCRVGLAAPHGFHARGLHATSVCGVLAASVVASLLTRSGTDTTVHAMGIAGSSAGGLLEFLSTGSSTKQLHPGSAALSGILAARLAAEGASGPASVLEGSRGLYAALSAVPADPDLVVDGLGERWETERIGIKPYPACQLLHVTLDAVAAVLTHVPTPEQVQKVVAHVHRDSIPTVCEPAADKATPRTVYDAKFSLPWTVAALLVDGRVDLDTFAPESISRPAVAALAAKIHAVASDEGGAAANASGCVEVHLDDGRVLVGRVDRSRGTPDAPLSEQDLRAKFLVNTGGAPAGPDLADAVLDLASAPSLTELLRLCRRVVEEAAA